MHPTRNTCPYRPVSRVRMMLDGFPQVFADYELNRFTTKVMREDRYWSACHHCIYRSQIASSPGAAERSILAHLIDRHGRTPSPATALLASF